MGMIMCPEGGVGGAAGAATQPQCAVERHRQCNGSSQDLHPADKDAPVPPRGRLTWVFKCTLFFWNLINILRSCG